MPKRPSTFWTVGTDDRCSVIISRFDEFIEDLLREYISDIDISMYNSISEQKPSQDPGTITISMPEPADDVKRYISLRELIQYELNSNRFTHGPNAGKCDEDVQERLLGLRDELMGLADLIDKCEFAPSSRPT